MTRHWHVINTVVVTVLSAVSLASAVYAEPFFVHSAKAPLFEASSFSSKTLSVLVKGDEVTLVSRSNRWLEVVDASGVRGWVSVLLVKSTPPGGTVSVIGSDQVELEGNARMRASAVATAGATRGLVEGNESNALSFDFEELYRVENFIISAQEITQFSVPIAEGN